MKRAGAIRRVMAFLIDLPFVLALLAVESVLAGLGVAFVSALLPRGDRLQNEVAQGLGILLLFVGPLPYFAGLESSPLEATVGKLLLRIRVVTEDGQRVLGVQASSRFMLKWLGLYPSGAGFLVALVRPDHRPFHDSVSHTRVVRL